MPSLLSGKAPAVAAEELGLHVVLPAANEVFLDIDDADSLTHYDTMMAFLVSNNHPMRETKRTTSKSGNTHIYLDAGRALTAVERIAWQAILGSDSKRELFSMLRVEANDPLRPPTVFFEKEAA